MKMTIMWEGGMLSISNFEKINLFWSFVETTSNFKFAKIGPKRFEGWLNYAHILNWFDDTPPPRYSVTSTRRFKMTETL